MRIKVESTPPLATFKAWFVVSAASSVQDLKESLCSDIPVLHEQEVTANEITLVLDGFELLDSSSIDVVRDGDLVNVKQRVIVTRSVVKKRKAESTEPLPASKRAKNAPTVVKSNKAAHDVSTTQAKTKHPRLSLSSSSSEESSSSSSEASDSSSDDSSSDSDDSDDSDSSNSSTSSSSAPSVETSKAQSGHQKIPKAVHISAVSTTHQKNAPEHFVPPGQGKTATKNRNLRRRLKKQHERLAAEQASNGLLGVNNIPLGPQVSAPVLEKVLDTSADDHTVPAPGPSTPQPLMMASLSNKNKRKGFKQAMASTQPRKIVFADPEAAPIQAEQAPLPFPTASTSEVTAAAPSIFPRLIPPSEKQENGQLPINMFVTSIDVEEGMYPSRKKNKKKQNPQQQQPWSETQEVENVVLDYGAGDAADDMIPTQRESNAESSAGKDKIYTSASEGIWETTEMYWDTLPTIKGPESVVGGELIARKELGFDTVTYTPEILLKIGIAKRAGDNLVIQPLVRPGTANISFGRVSAEVDEEEELIPEEETYDWETVISGGWKLAGILS